VKEVHRVALLLGALWVWVAAARFAIPSAREEPAAVWHDVRRADGALWRISVAKEEARESAPETTCDDDPRRGLTKRFSKLGHAEGNIAPKSNDRVPRLVASFAVSSKEEEAWLGPKRQGADEGEHHIGVCWAHRPNVEGLVTYRAVTRVKEVSELFTQRSAGYVRRTLNQTSVATAKEHGWIRTQMYESVTSEANILGQRNLRRRGVRSTADDQDGIGLRGQSIRRRTSWRRGGSRLFVRRGIACSQDAKTQN
jgi:hypothetical protein